MESNRETPRRRWWHFSRRFLLLLALIVVMYSGGWFANQWKYQRELEQNKEGRYRTVYVKLQRGQASWRTSAELGKRVNVSIEPVQETRTRRSLLNRHCPRRSTSFCS